MSGVERHQYFDNNLAQQMTETVQRENRIRDKFIEQYELERRIKKAETLSLEGERPPPTPEEELPPPAPPTRKLTQKEMQTKLSVELTKNMWKKLIPGFQIGAHTVQSTSKEHYAYPDPEDIEPVIRTHCRKRDEHALYVEARAKYNMMMGAKGSM